MKKLLTIIFGLSFALNCASMEAPSAVTKKRALNSVCPTVIYSNPYFDEKLKINRIDAYLKDPEKDLLIGGIQYLKAGSVGKICLMKVLESQRKAGVGFKLFKKAIYNLHSNGCTIIIWDAVTSPQNNILELKTIYEHMAQKLQDKLSADFICGNIKKTTNFHTIPMKLVIKNSNKKSRVTSKKSAVGTL